MGQLQVIKHPSSDTNSSDSYDHYQPNGVIENALRLYVDAWNSEAFLWVSEIVRDDWNHWCVPAVRHQLYTTMGGGGNDVIKLQLRYATECGAVGEVRAITASGVSTPCSCAIPRNGQPT